jgi:branched-chain amino acid transport system permease protein
MTIIGSVGMFVGPVSGAAGLELLDTVLRDAEGTIGIGERWALILGIIFVVVVIVFPHGMVGMWRRWWFSQDNYRVLQSPKKPV